MYSTSRTQCNLVVMQRYASPMRPIAGSLIPGGIRRVQRSSLQSGTPQVAVSVQERAGSTQYLPLIPLLRKEEGSALSAGRFPLAGPLDNTNISRLDPSSIFGTEMIQLFTRRTYRIQMDDILTGKVRFRVVGRTCFLQAHWRDQMCILGSTPSSRQTSLRKKP